MIKLLRYALYQQYDGIYRYINGLFYYLKKIPFFGKFIPETIYQSYGFKTSLLWIFGLFSFPLRFLMKAIWLGFFVFMANCGINLVNHSDNLFYFQNDAPFLGFLFWFFFVGFSYHFGQAFNYAIAKPEREFVQNFRLSWETHLQSQIWIRPLLITLFYLPALVIVSLVVQDIWVFLIGSFTILTSDLAGASVKRILYQKQVTIKAPFYITTILLTFSSIILSTIFYKQLSHLPLLVIWLLQVSILYLSYRYLTRFADTDGFVAHCIEESIQFDQKIVEATQGNEYTRQGLAMQKQLSLKTAKDLSHLTGMAYINALLFQRYRPILTRKFIWRIGCILLIMAAGLLTRFFPEMILTEKELHFIIPFLFLLMYALSLGRAIAQMVFVNCDIAMLHYPFYRQGKNIIAGFNYRWLQSLTYNSCFAVGIFLALLIWGQFRYPLGTVALLALLLVSLTALLSFHDLFIYYLLQPFTKDMEVVNPVYKILSSGLYWIAYFNMKITIDSTLYVYIVSGLLLFYVGIGYLVLLKLAPKTFVLKQ